MKKILSVILLCALVLSVFTACSGENTPAAVKAFDKEVSSEKPTNKTVAQNGKYTLEFDENTCGITLTDSQSGKSWGTSPPESDKVRLDKWGDPITRHPRVNSVLSIEYVSAETGNTETVISKTGALKEGRIVCKALENGIRVEYYFDSPGFMIPVDYILREDSLLATINPADIEESENQVTSVALAPFFCAAENDADNSWMLIPSGSGTLIYPKTLSQQGTNYSAQVYGEDASIEKWDMPSSEKSVRLPVYGAKTGETAVFAVIEQGAESAVINVTSGSEALGYSSVYASFVLRGYTNNIADLMPGERVKNVIYADGMITTPLSVAFYPLSGENADYSGMAALYRGLLEKSDNLRKTEKESPLNLNIIGGATVSKSFLGVPYKSLFAATDATEAEEIIKKLIADGYKPTVRLTGFGEEGISTDTLAGGFKISSKLGGKSGINSLLDYCKANGVNAYVDFDIIKFKSGAAGFSSLFDSALCASRKIAYIYDFDIAARGRDESTRARLLARDKLIKCGETLLKKTASLNTDGYSFNTLSNTAYSDYSDKTSSAAYSKAGMAADVKKILSAFAGKNKKIAVSDANVYAAAHADIITETPTSSAAEDIFDADIPFYQMVFKGRVQITSESVNLAADPEKRILKSVEGGCGLTYTVTADYDKSLLDIRTKDFYNSLFDDVYPVIKKNTEKLSDYYEKISGAEITKHTVINENLRCTQFDNGITVYVNFGDSDEQTPFGNVGAGDFIIGGDGNAKNKHRGIESLKSRYGLMFIAPWFLGFVLFFAIPVFQSVWFSLSDVTLSNSGLVTKFVGLSHYRYALLQSGAYTATLGTAVTSLLYQLPIIVLISMVLSLILNQKFRGRTFFRALFFLPVIIATGIVMDILFMTTGSMSESTVNESLSGNMFNVSDVAAFLDLPSGISDYAEKAISNIFDLIWNSGIQTVLFIAGLQSVPSSLYEASRVEGATKWEEFWFITFPSLSQVTLLVIIYTMVEQFTSSRNPMINAMYTLMKGGNYDETSAVLWFYFALVGIIMGILIWAYNRFLVKRWS